MIGTRIGDVTLVAEADIPEPGWWFATDGTWEGLPLWVRMPRADVFDDAIAIATAWERLVHLDHPLLPHPMRFDPGTGAMIVAAPAAVPLARLLEARHEKAFTITPATVLELGRSLADAVVHAHERGRPHGHLSPDNVMLAADGRLVIWGFASGPDAACSERWQAPERARGHRASGDADQWSIAAILASVITGRIPWRGDDPHAEARVGDAQHLHSPVMEQWPPLGRALRRALSSEPRERFPSTHPLRQALDALRQRVPQQSDLPTMGAWLAERYGPAPVRPADPVAVEAPVEDEAPVDVDQHTIEDETVQAPSEEPDAPTDVGEADGPPTDVADPVPVVVVREETTEPLASPARGGRTMEPADAVELDEAPVIRLPSPPSPPRAPGGLASARVRVPEPEPMGPVTAPTQIPDEGTWVGDEGPRAPGPATSPEALAATRSPRLAMPLKPSSVPTSPDGAEVSWDEDSFDVSADDEAATDEPPTPAGAVPGGWSLDGSPAVEGTVPDASVPGIAMATRRGPVEPPAWWEPWAQPAARVIVPLAAVALLARLIVPWFLG